MSYTPPTIGTSGLQIPSFNDILSNLIGQYQSIFGTSVYLGTDSADYQDIAVRALMTSDVNQVLQAAWLAFNPQTAIGASLDLLGKLIGSARNAATYSSATVTLSGTPGTVVTNGIVEDVNGNFWTVASPTTIGAGGTVSVPATCNTIGNITANAGTITIISTPTAGWTAVTNSAAAIPGVAVELDSSYRARLLLAQAKPSLTLLAGTSAAIAAVSGVTRSQVYENPTNSTDTYGNPAHSITCVVEGGSNAAVAQAIYSNRGIGCLTNGTTTVTVTDALNPAITMPISFDILGYIQVYVSLTVHALAGFSSATLTNIQTAIVTYLNSLGIGENVVYSELYGAALNARPNPDTPLFSIRSLASGALTVQTTGTFSSGTTAVTVASGTSITTGQAVVGTGIAPGTTVAGITGTSLTLSQNSTAAGTGVTLSFFTLGTSDISVPFNDAAQGSSLNVYVGQV